MPARLYLLLALGGMFLGLNSCAREPVIVLNLPAWPAESTSLLLRTSLNGVSGESFSYERGSERIAIYLPTASSGLVELHLFWLNANRCAVADGKLMQEVPDGLRAFAEEWVASSPITPSLCFEALPPVTTRNLTAVWGSDADNVYAVGDGAIVRCAAHRPTCTSLKFAPQRALDSVWGSDAANVYAVGDNGTIVRCASGRDTCTKLTTNTTASLHKVWGSDAANVYAVGDNGTVVRCSAGSLNCATVNSGTTEALYSVWGSDAANVFVVGNGGTILRCSAGSRCSKIPSGTTQLFKSVWGSDAEHVYAMGQATVRCSASTMMCKSLGPDPNSQFTSVWGSDANNVYAVGGDGDGIIRCSAGSDTCVSLEIGEPKDLVGLGGYDPQNIYAVSTSGAVLRCSAAPGTCKTIYSSLLVRPGADATYNLMAVWGSNTKQLYFVGGGGTILRSAF